MLLVLFAGGGGYLFGHSRGADPHSARLAGETAGRIAGTKAGTERGYAAGLKRGARSSYGKAYKRAYKRALSTPTPVKVGHDKTPGTSND